MSAAMRRGKGRGAWKSVTMEGMIKGVHTTQIIHRRVGERPSASEDSPVSFGLLFFICFNSLVLSSFPAQDTALRDFLLYSTTKPGVYLDTLSQLRELSQCSWFKYTGADSFLVVKTIMKWQ